jgi:dTMP kinase
VSVKSALVIALVGIDGSGKTTQAIRLAAELCLAGLPARYGRNAGGRRFLGLVALHLGRRDAVALVGQRGLLVVESLLRWLAIARSLLVARLTGRVAVMDRYTVCQLVSLRVHDGGGLLHRLVRAAYAVFPAPTVMLYLDIPPEQAYRRVEQRGSDHEELAYLMDCRAAYLDLASTAIRVDASGTTEEVAAAIASAVWPSLRPDLPVDATLA